MATDMTEPCWDVAIDTGGTFTDCLARDPADTRRRVKVLSSSVLRPRFLSQPGARTLQVDFGEPLPMGFCTGASMSLGEDTLPVRIIDHGDLGMLRLDRPVRSEPGLAIEVRFALEAPVLGMHLLTGVAPGSHLPPVRLRLATTRATNALLERKGTPPVLFITAGFEDLLRIGNQSRPDIFALAVRREEPLTTHIVGVAARVSVEGRELQPLDEEALRQQAREHVRAGRTTAAVSLLHGAAHPAHERRVAAILREEGFVHCSVAHELDTTTNFLARTQTTVVDAYLAPVIHEYLDNIRRQAGGLVSFQVMTSAGSLVNAADYRPRDSLLSGPAGGVVGAGDVGRAIARAHLLAFDMGGTSTDVSRIDGDPVIRYESAIAGVSLLAPTLAIETVAAGGGSICWFDGMRLHVGPQSAGASPGPACYGRGGPLTITDVNLILGRLVTRNFSIPLSANAATHRLEELCEAMQRAGSASVDLHEIAKGLLRIANERMAEAIRAVSVREGVDPTRYTLVSFGGAGGQHACDLAELLGVRDVLFPPDASLLSAHGLSVARPEAHAARDLLQPLESCRDNLEGILQELEREALEALSDTPGATILRRVVNLRFVGQNVRIALTNAPIGELETRFHREYEALFGYRPEERALEVESLRAVAGESPRHAEAARTPASSQSASPANDRVSVCIHDAWREVPIYSMGAIRSGDTIEGPALVEDPFTSILINPGWRAVACASGGLLLTHSANQ